jgi:peroxiredoxin
MADGMTGALRVGDPMPDVTLIDHDGRPWNPRGFAGRPVVMILHRHLA